MSNMKMEWDRLIASIFQIKIVFYIRSLSLFLEVFVWESFCNIQALSGVLCDTEEGSLGYAVISIGTHSNFCVCHLIASSSCVLRTFRTLFSLQEGYYFFSPSNLREVNPHKIGEHRKTITRSVRSLRNN
jgi:hypothetical protein